MPRAWDDVVKEAEATSQDHANWHKYAEGMSPPRPSNIEVRKAALNAAVVFWGDSSEVDFGDVIDAAAFFERYLLTGE